MLITKDPARRATTQSRAAVAIFAATLLVGGSVTGASARSPRHHLGHRHFHQASNARVHHASNARGGASRSPWREAHAAIVPTSGGTFSGMASFYGNESGSKTASGQRFNQNDMTCAHRTLPFGTKLKVTHGDRSVVVTVNDRGPFVRGRVLDLSTAAARAVGLTVAGVGRVVAEIM